MYTVKNGEEFINDIRAIDERIKNIRLSSIEVSRKDKTLKYNFICDATVDEELKQKIENGCTIFSDGNIHLHITDRY